MSITNYFYNFVEEVEWCSATLKGPRENLDIIYTGCAKQTSRAESVSHLTV